LRRRNVSTISHRTQVSTRARHYSHAITHHPYPLDHHCSCPNSQRLALKRQTGGVVSISLYPPAIVRSSLLLVGHVPCRTFGICPPRTASATKTRSTTCCATATTRSGRVASLASSSCAATPPPCKLLLRRTPRTTCRCSCCSCSTEGQSPTRVNNVAEPVYCSLRCNF